MNLEILQGTITRGTIKDLDYDYQAEQWVLETHHDTRVAEPITEWVLYDEIGIRCAWKLSDDKNNFPVITQRSSRFTGTWEKGPNEVSI
ncbi:MAG: hypothetical protein WAX81_02365 [Candidatus Moraniibacteriota bacterium]